MGHLALIDRSLIDPGDRWRAKLLSRLGSCHGGVVLLTRAAANRDWVRAESLSLGWRAWLNPAMRVLPVLIDKDLWSATLDGLGLSRVGDRRRWAFSYPAGLLTAAREGRRAPLPRLRRVPGDLSRTVARDQLSGMIRRRLASAFMT